MRIPTLALPLLLTPTLLAAQGTVWTVDDDGFAEITHTLTVTGDQYLRLRGTNVSVETAGETVDGEPLPDQKVDFDNDAARFDAINARNYNDLWFYSNPIFVSLVE